MDDRGSFKARWVDATNATIDADHAVFRGTRWESLQVFSGEGAELPYVLASLTGSRSLPSALGHLEKACFHQGSAASAAKPVAQALVAMLDAGLGAPDEILQILTTLPFGQFLSNARKKKLNIGGGRKRADGRHRGILKVDGTKWICEYGLRGGELDGPFVAYGEAGKPAREGAYEGGKKSGPWRFFNVKGWLEEQGEFRDGKKHGTWITFEILGKRLREETFVDGMKDGPYRAYYFNGKPREEGAFANGKKEGVFREWHYSGGKRRERTFVNGKQRGPAEAWDEEGNPVAP